MFKKDIFFENYFIKSNNYIKNFKKTKNIFNSFLTDLERNNPTLLESYNKNYKFDFSKTTIKKFSKYKNIIIIGMGGSILGIKSIYSFLKKKIKKNVFFFDNLDPILHSEYKKIKNLNNSCFIVVSKSGNTLETITNLSIIFSKVLFKNKLVIITEKTSNNLMTIANKYNGKIILHKKFIGGRYSVLSEPGMFPAALMGLNLVKFKNLKRLVKNKKFVSSLLKNVATIYTLNLRGVNNSIILNYDSSLNDLGYWHQQLVAESLGKNGKGINPMLSSGPKDHHSLLQLYLEGPKDKFFTFFNFSTKGSKENKKIESVIQAQCRAVKNIFNSKKIPFRQITFSKKSEDELGKILTFFVLEIILLSRLMNINPFDQPAVEEVKIQTKRFLR